MSEYHCERATSAHAPGLLALFESAGSGCYCNYWHFQGDKNAWLERCFVQPEENRLALIARLAAPELCGFVARELGASDDAEIVGWLKVVPSMAVPRLYDQRVYRRLPYFEAQTSEQRERTYTVACMYVAERARGRGLASSLLSAAIAGARDAGGLALEAFPRGAPSDGEAALRPDEVWLGPERLYVSAGFRAVTDFRPYPVLRLDLA